MQMQPISRAYASQEAAKHAIFPWSRRPTVPTAQRTRVAAVLRPLAVSHFALTARPQTHYASIRLPAKCNPVTAHSAAVSYRLTSLISTAAKTLWIKIGDRHDPRHQTIDCNRRRDQ